MHPAIQVRHDRVRGCGFRKPGGMYLCSGGVAAPCGKLPIPLDVCPTCHAGIKPTRGWTWVNGTAFAEQTKCEPGRGCAACPLGGPLGRCGLQWIGEKFYATPAAFMREADEQGVSRRLSAVPKDFEIGKTWVLLAHRKAIENADGSFTAAVFQTFRPERIEYVVTGEESDQEIEALVERGITPVSVSISLEEAAGVAVEPQQRAV